MRTRTSLIFFALAVATASCGGDNNSSGNEGTGGAGGGTIDSGSGDTGGSGNSSSDGSPDGKGDSDGSSNADAAKDAKTDSSDTGVASDASDAGDGAITDGSDGGDGDVDPCATSNGGCSTNATCARSDAGAAACTCKEGFYGTGTTCTACSVCAAGSYAVTACTATTNTAGCTPALDLAAVKTVIGDKDAAVVKVVTMLQSIVDLFIDQGTPNLNLGTSATQNAGYLLSRATALTPDACESDIGTSDAVVGQLGSKTTLNVTTTGCLINGLKITGTEPSSAIVTAEVTKPAGPISVKFTLANFGVNGTVLNGTVTVGTTDLTTYTELADVTVSGLGRIVWGGGSGSVSSGIATVSGTVAFTPESANDAGATTTNFGHGLTCLQPAATALTLANVTRPNGACYPSGGTATATRTLSCSQNADGGGFSATVTSTVGLAWPGSQANQVKVTASTKVGSGAASAGTEEDVTVGWTCESMPDDAGAEGGDATSPGDGGDAGDDGDAGHLVEAGDATAG